MTNELSIFHRKRPGSRAGTTTVVGIQLIVIWRYVFSFLVDFNNQYVISARSNGISDSRVLFKHIFQNPTFVRPECRDVGDGFWWYQSFDAYSGGSAVSELTKMALEFVGELGLVIFLNAFRESFFSN